MLDDLLGCHTCCGTGDSCHRRGYFAGPVSVIVAGRDEVQGFFFSKPVPASEVETLLSKGADQVPAVSS